MKCLYVCVGVCVWVCVGVCMRRTIAFVVGMRTKEGVLLYNSAKAKERQERTCEQKNRRTEEQNIKKESEIAAMHNPMGGLKGRGTVFWPMRCKWKVTKEAKEGREEQRT